MKIREVVSKISHKNDQVKKRGAKNQQTHAFRGWAKLSLVSSFEISNFEEIKSRKILHFTRDRSSQRNRTRKFALSEISRRIRMRIFAFCEISHYAKNSHAKNIFAFCEIYANPKWALRSDANAKFRKIFASHANFANFACESTSLVATVAAPQVRISANSK